MSRDANGARTTRSRFKCFISGLQATTALVSAGMAASSALATDYVASTETELSNALLAQADGDTITLAGDITLTANLPDVHSDVTIFGGGHTLSGADAYRGLMVMSGTVRVEDLTISDALAIGGVSTSGGSSAGLGGAIFVNEGAAVTVSNVDLLDNAAQGGAPAGTSTSYGGGGVGGAGMLGNNQPNGVGGAPNGGAGGEELPIFSVTSDSTTVADAPDGRDGEAGGTGGGGGGGGGGGRWTVDVSNGDATANGGNGGKGGDGGFGGGGGQGGSGSLTIARATNPGVASGSGGDGGDGGAGGFGGGGGTGGFGGVLDKVQRDEVAGTSTSQTINTGNGGNGGQGGFGGSGGLGGQGAATGATLGDGTAAGMGGALFVRQGGSLVVEGKLNLNGNAVQAGGAGSKAFGTGIFLQGSGNLVLRPDSGETQTIADNIADMVGVVAQGYVPPAGTYVGNERWGVTVDGRGTLVLSGSNSFSGGVLVSEGTLSVEADANLGNPDGDVVLETGALATTASFVTDRDLLLSLGGTLSQAAGTALTINGIISGGGGLTKTGAGTLVLRGDNTYAADTNLDAGTLQLEHDHALGTGPLNAAEGTTIQYGLSNLVIANIIGIEGDVTFDYEQPGPIIVAIPEQAGKISGTGRLIRDGTGSLILSHANSYHGGTLVRGGRLIASVTGALGTGDATVADGGVLAFAGTAVTSTEAGARTITVGSGGRLQFADYSNAAATTVENGAGGLVELSGDIAPVAIGSLSGAGDVDLGFGAMVLGSLDTDDAISGVIRDGNVPPILLPAAQVGSLVKTGAGILTLFGTSTYFGTTTVEEGTLIVNGSIANSSLTTVASGAMLGGGGTVGNTRVEGTIAPGNSIGTLDVNGTFTQAIGSTYAVELDASSSDLIAVTGTADLQGGTIEVEAAPSSYAIGARYTILTAAGGVTGEYAAVTGDAGPLSAFVSVVDSYDANNVYLDVLKVRDFADAGLTPNQIATGEGLDSIPQSGPLFTAVAGLATDAEARAAFDVLSGEVHASVKGMFLQDSRFVRDAAISRIASAFGDGIAAQMPVMAYGQGGPETAAADTDRFAVWGQTFGSWGDADSDGNAASFSRSTGGLLIGADAPVGETWRLGVIGGYGHTNFDADDRLSSGDSDNYHLGIYGGAQWSALGLTAGAAYSWHDVSTSRSVDFIGFSDQLSTDYDAGTAQIFGELSYKIERGSLSLTPFANLAYVDLHTDEFSEQGGAAALTSAASTTDATFTTLGIRASNDFTLGRVQAIARGTLGWRHAFGDTTPLAGFAFSDGDAFGVAGVPIASDSFVIEAGLDLNFSSTVSLGLSYTGQFASSVSDNGANATLRVKF